MHQVKRFTTTRPCLLLVLLATVIACGELSDGSRVMAQNAVQGAAATEQAEPSFRDYKGVSIGMSADEARKKLGNPQEKGETQDFYSFSDTETAQVFYDKAHKVSAISINYLGTGGSVPQPKAIVGTDIEAKADGAMHKLVRFPKAGFWVSYSRTAGDDPLVTVTLKKIE